MQVNHYETVFILTPVLSEAQMKDTVDKFKKVVQDSGAKVVHEENWGLKKLAYPIQHKKTGFYQLFQIEGAAEVVAKLDLEFGRDERIMRFMTIALDKYALAYAEKRKKGFPKKEAKEKSKEEVKS